MAARAAEERARTGSARLVVESLEERMEVMAVEKAVGSLRLGPEGRRGVVFGLGFREEVSESEVEGEVSKIDGSCSLLGETSSLSFSRSMSEDEAEEARSMAGKSEGSTSSKEAEEELLL